MICPHCDARRLATHGTHCWPCRDAILTSLRQPDEQDLHLDPRWLLYYAFRTGAVVVYPLRYNPAPEYEEVPPWMWMPYLQEAA